MFKIKHSDELCANFIKLVFIILLISIFIPNQSWASSYHFSSTTGNDNYTSQQAKNSNTPWKSINKLNLVFPTLIAGDSILFKRGEIFEGAITISKSGSAFAPIVFSAYGQGNTPVISGLTGLWNWTALGNGIYESPLSVTATNLMFDNAQQPLGRYPNTGYLTYEASETNTSITDYELNGTTNWTGAEVVIRKNRWTIDRAIIKAHYTGYLIYENINSAYSTNGYGYFIQNHIKTLDKVGEWLYDAKTKKVFVYYGTESPSAHVVRVSTLPKLVDIKGFNFINFENLAFVGAGEYAFNLVNAKNISIKNCRIEYTGFEAIMASFSPFLKLENNIILNSLSGGFNLDVGCTNASIINNTIKNTGLIAGLGRSGNGTYEAITAFGDATQIEKNIIENTGYCGIYFGGNSSYAKNNIVTNFCFVKDDGAGIYVGDWSATYNKRIEGNIISEGKGNSEGTNYITSLQAEGIYVDDQSQSVNIINNTVFACANNGIKVHNAKDIFISKNTLFNNGAQLRLEQDHYIPTSTYIRNNNIKNNIFFSKSEAQSTSKLSSHQDDIASFGNLDSNFYCRPLNELANINITLVRNGQNLEQNYDLTGWKTAYGKDPSSKISPTNISPYKISQLIGLNKFPTGNFDQDINNLYWYSTINDGYGVLDYGTLDGGSLKIIANSSAAANNTIMINLKVGRIEANKKYVMSFSLKGSENEKSLKAYLRKTGWPYNYVSDQKNIKISTTRTENEFIFSSIIADDDASIIFELSQASGAVYFDNVKLTEAIVETTNIDEQILFDYNTNSFAKTVWLTKPYVDVYNNFYTDKITIAPYSSVVLMAANPPVAKVSQTIVFSSLTEKTINNQPINLLPVASSGLPVKLEVVSGPAFLIGNTLKFKDYGTVIIKGKQAGNEKFEAAVTETQILNIADKNSIVEVATLAAELKVYPNPFTSKITVEFTLPSSANGTVSLYNLQGLLIKEIYTGNIKEKEKNVLEVNTSELNLIKGVYLLRLVTENEVLFQKIISLN